MNQEKIISLINAISPARIVAATKYVDAAHMRTLFAYGIKDFGENRTDSFLEKYEALRDLPVTWHFIGHLQRNKAALVADKIDVLHSLDSLALAKVLQDRRSEPLDVFVELKLTDNDAKNGVLPEDLPAFLEGLAGYDKIHVIGFMAMTDPDMTDEEKEAVFRRAAELGAANGFCAYSMGMSDDYGLAVAAGATHVRLGRILFEPEDFKEEFKHYIG